MTAIERADRGAAIRQAARADLLDVYRIEKNVFDQPWPFSAFERYVDEPGFLVSEDPDADDDEPLSGENSPLVGYVVADAIPNHGRPLGHVKDIAVRPDRRGEGHGRRLLEHGLSVLTAQGVRSVKLEVRRSNEPARGLYEDFGFEVLRTIPRYYSDGEDAFIMVAHLGDDRDAF